MPDIRAIINAIKECRENAAEVGTGGFSEADTVDGLIKPMLQALGWKPLKNMKSQYNVPGGGLVDIALFVDDKPRIFVEAKAYAGAGRSHLSEKDVKQVISYGAVGGASWCLLTNGLCYELYYMPLSLELRDKRALSIDLQELSPEEAAPLLSLLSAEAVKSGKLDREGLIQLVLARLQEACREGDPALVKPLQDKFDGKISEEIIREALRQLVCTSRPTAPQTSRPKTTQGKEKTKTLFSRRHVIDETTGEYTLRVTYHGEPEQTKEFRGRRLPPDQDFQPDRERLRKEITNWIAQWVPDWPKSKIRHKVYDIVARIYPPSIYPARPLEAKAARRQP